MNHYCNFQYSENSVVASCTLEFIFSLLSVKNIEGTICLVLKKKILQQADEMSEFAEY